MALIFPASPALGDTYTDPTSGVTYVAVKSGTPAEWVSAGVSGSGDSGFGTLTGGAPTAILSNSSNPAVGQVGLDLNSYVSGLTPDASPPGLTELYLRSQGFEDIEFISPLVPGRESGKVDIRLFGFKTIKSVAVLRKSNCSHVTIDFREGNLTTVDGIYLYLQSDAGADLYMNAIDATSLSTIDKLDIHLGRGIATQYVSYYIDLSGCALDQASVDRVLIAFEKAVIGSGQYSSSSSFIDLSGGSSAGPGAAGLAAINSLTSAGGPSPVTITTN